MLQYLYTSSNTGFHDLSLIFQSDSLQDVQRIRSKGVSEVLGC